MHIIKKVYMYIYVYTILAIRNCTKRTVNAAFEKRSYNSALANTDLNLANACKQRIPQYFLLRVRQSSPVRGYNSVREYTFTNAQIFERLNDERFANTREKRTFYSISKWGFPLGILEEIRNVQY